MIGNVGHERMKELRAIIPVAIGVAEDMWKRTRQHEAAKQATPIAKGGGGSIS